MNLNQLNVNSNNSVCNSPAPMANNVRRRSKLGFTNDKKLSDDEFMAAAIGDTEWLRQSLRNNGGAINYDKNGLAPIHLAAIHGRLDCLRLLVEKFKVDVNLASTTGWRPIHLAISNQTGKRSFNCLTYLLAKGGDPSIKNEDGLTPMHQAASEGHVQCMKALIDAGADIDGEDVRGHKPIDLAKLWGHKKCGRILAAEMWHRDKDFIAKEMKQLQKVKMHQVLREIEEDEDNRKDRQFYGDTAFKQWLDGKALPEKTTAPPSTRKTDRPSKSNDRGFSGTGKRGLGSEQRAPLHKANSFQLPASRAGRTPVETPVPKTEPEEVTDRAPVEDAEKRRASEVKFSEPDPPTVEDEESENKEEIRPVYVNPTRWNKSPKVAPPEYVKILPDHYPRDIYTCLPKHAPTRKRSPKGGEEKTLHSEGTSSAGFHRDDQTSLRMPKLPTDVIEKALGTDQSKKERRVVFQCENIIDVQMRKHYDPDCDPIVRSEIGLHFTNQLDSRLYRSALQPERIPTTPSTVISGISSSRSSNSTRSSGTLGSVRVDVASVRSLMDKVSKTAIYAELQVPEISPKATQPVV